MQEVKTIFKPSDPSAYIELPEAVSVGSLTINVPEGEKPSDTLIKFELLFEIIRQLASKCAGEDIKVMKVADIKTLDDKVIDAEVAEVVN